MQRRAGPIGTKADQAGLHSDAVDEVSYDTAKSQRYTAWSESM